MKFERALDATNANSATEWTLVSVPVVGENTDDIEDALASGSGDNNGKRAIGTFNNDTGAYVYYDDGASVDPCCRNRISCNSRHRSNSSRFSRNI